MATLDQPVSRRERQVLEMLAEGLSTADMADRHYVSESTIKKQREILFRKLGAVTAAQAVHRAHQLGLLDDGGAGQANEDDLAVLRQAREMGYRIALVPHGAVTG